MNAVALDGDSLLVGLGLVHAPVPLLWAAARERVGRLAERAGLGRLAGAAVRAWRRSPGARIGAPPPRP